MHTDAPLYLRRQAILGAQKKIMVSRSIAIP